MRFFAPSRDSRTDDARFEALFLRHYRRVHAILARLLPTPEAVEDAVQEVFLRLYRQERPPVDPADDEALGRWLARVATNVGLNALRTDRRQAARLQRGALLGHAEDVGREAGQDPARSALVREEAELVERALAGMAERARACLLLRHGGLSYAEIAAALDVAPGSVGTILARAEREFRRRYLELAGEHASEGLKV